MWQVTWYNYYGKVETHIMSDKDYQTCVNYDSNYYITASKLSDV